VPAEGTEDTGQDQHGDTETRKRGGLLAFEKSVTQCRRVKAPPLASVANLREEWASAHPSFFVFGGGFVPAEGTEDAGQALTRRHGDTEAQTFRKD
jgi:hypothetical protein